MRGAARAFYANPCRLPPDPRRRAWPAAASQIHTIILCNRPERDMSTAPARAGHSFAGRRRSRIRAAACMDAYKGGGQGSRVPGVNSRLNRINSQQKRSN